MALSPRWLGIIMQSVGPSDVEWPHSLCIPASKCFVPRGYGVPSPTAGAVMQALVDPDITVQAKDLQTRGAAQPHHLVRRHVKVPPTALYHSNTPTAPHPTTHQLAALTLRQCSVAVGA